MSFRFPVLCCVLALPLAARAETTVPEGGTVQLDPVVTTASPLARAADEIAQPLSVLGGDQLQQHLAGTLGETLSGQPGVDSTYFGPGASRPVIRGLGGDRIRVLSGGVGTMDASVVSPDHAVSLDPLLVDRIEVVRGPAALLYGGGAIGGVVNVLDERIPERRPDAPLTGRLELRGATAADEFSGAGVLTGAAGPIAWRLDGFRRQTGDVAIPGMGPTPERAAEMQAAGEEISNGRLINSATETSGGSIGASYLAPHGHLGFAYNGFDSQYGTVAEQDVTINLRQRRLDVHGELMPEDSWLRAVKLQAGFGDYRHDEMEGADLGTRFTNRGYEGRLEFLHAKTGPFEGALGLQASASDFAALGEEAFLPPTDTRNRAVFVYEEAVTGPLTWQLGGRAERQTITPEAGSGLDARRHNLRTLTGGVVYKLSPEYSLAVSVSANERAPNAQELFADGPHAGTGTYELGDATLGVERSTGFDVSLRRRAGFVTAELSAFVNRFRGYIFEQDTGTVQDDLPVFAFVQRDARLEGGEAELTFHLRDEADAATSVRVFVDSVRATNTTDGTPLPRTTPLRFGAAFDWRRGPWSLGTEVRRVEAQNRVAPIETATRGYTLWNVTASRRLAWGRQHATIFVRATNLLDETARVHASFLKDLAPLPGRDLSAGLRWEF